MTEYETDPQRRPAPSDAEPSHPTAELSRVETGQSDSPAVEPAAPAAPTAHPTYPGPAAPAAGQHTPAAPVSGPVAPGSGPQPYAT
ncbi:peptidase S1, partial [Micromonospora sp. DH15]|nr:peptidase S1 [Micromonospora sp. DH15]